MNESKSLFASLTFWSVVAMVAAQIARRYGFTIDADGLANDLLSAAGVAGSIYGRMRASAPAHVLTPSTEKKETP